MNGKKYSAHGSRNQTESKHQPYKGAEFSLFFGLFDQHRIAEGAFVVNVYAKDAADAGRVVRGELRKWAAELFAKTGGEVAPA